MDRLHKEGWSPQDIGSALRTSRGKRGEPGPSQSAVYSFLAGKTYVRGRSETRGRKSRLPPRIVQTANRERICLIREADNEHLVTWQDVRDATKRVLQARGALRRGVRMPSTDWLARRVRAKTAVRARPGKRRISRFPKHVTAWVSVAAPCHKVRLSEPGQCLFERSWNCLASSALLFCARPCAGLLRHPSSVFCAARSLCPQWVSR